MSEPSSHVRAPLTLSTRVRDNLEDQIVSLRKSLEGQERIDAIALSSGNAETRFPAEGRFAED